MKITKIAVGLTYTKNMGNYESMKYHMGLEAELTPDECEEEMARVGYSFCKEEIMHQLRLKQDKDGGISQKEEGTSHKVEKHKF